MQFEVQSENKENLSWISIFICDLKQQQKKKKDFQGLSATLKCEL